MFAALAGGDFFNNNDQINGLEVFPLVCPPQAGNFAIYSLSKWKSIVLRANSRLNFRITYRNFPFFLRYVLLFSDHVP